MAEALRRVDIPLTTHAPGKWRGEKRLCLGTPLFGFQCCVAPDKVGASLSFSFSFRYEHGVILCVKCLHGIQSIVGAQ